MSNNQHQNTPSRRLRPGDEVIVASRAEMLASLDLDGNLDGMPLMPQMLDLCGSRQTVYRRADKTCDTIGGTGGRRLHNTVHLTGMRCDGAAYGGCQAGCLMFFKEAWLRPVDEATAPMDEPAGIETAVMRGTRQHGSGRGDERYRCQATELVRASEPLAWWGPKQYWRDWRDNGVRLSQMLRAFSFWLFRQSLKLGAYNFQVRAFNRWQKLWGNTPYPFENGTLRKTPDDPLNLATGELVRVKSYDQILATLDRRNRTRGLFFDAEMVKFCGNIYRVQQRVTKIVDERSGSMINFGAPGIILDNVFCTSQVSPKRLFCPRSIHHYWREIWLERIEAHGKG